MTFAGSVLLALALQAQPVPPVTHYEAVPSVSAPALATDQVALQSDGYERMTAPVMIGKAGPFRFLVDTGADRTVVSSALAGRLGLAEAPGAVLHSATGAVAVRMVTVADLVVGQTRIARLVAPVLEAGDIGADGIIGIDALRGERVALDFRNRTLTVGSTPDPTPTDDEIVIRARRVGGRLVLTDADIGGIQVRIVIDTGSQLSVANLALRQRLERAGLVNDLQAGGLLSVTGQRLTGDSARIEEMRIGPVTLRQVAMLFADAHVFGQLGLDRRPSLLLGMDSLAAFDRVEIDFARKKLGLTLGTPHR